MRMVIPEAEDQVWSILWGYLEALRRTGNENVSEDTLHIAIQHTLNRLRPLYLVSMAKYIIFWRITNQFDKKEFNALKQAGAKQA